MTRAPGLSPRSWRRSGVSDALKIATFRTLQLLTTLFRLALAREAQPFGSMDGAMKFIIVRDCRFARVPVALCFGISTVRRPSANVWGWCAYLNRRDQ